jgi:mannose-6-phosphate isomerase-like protein (cupin superfamily)
MRFAKLGVVALLVCAAALVLAQTQAMKKVEKDKATYFGPADMAQAFTKATTLVNQPGLNFRASTGWRDRPGKVEVHENWTDVMYVISGDATFVTGGKMINGKPSAPGEIRGDDVAGGQTYHLQKGALLIIPAGVPHWLKSVESPLVDYVVKVPKQ